MKTFVAHRQSYARDRASTTTWSLRCCSLRECSISSWPWVKLMARDLSEGIDLDALFNDPMPVIV
jgi:hypothetical protein